MNLIRPVVPSGVNMFLDLFFGFAVGLVVGWNFLPQPQWVVDILNKVKEKVGTKPPAI